MSLWNHIRPDDLRPWRCPHCGVYENPGKPDQHECDPRSVVRVQAGLRVSVAEAAELEAWINPEKAA